MLTEPEHDPHRLALEQAIAKAVLERQAAGPRPTFDADAIALRQILSGLTSTQKAAVRAVLGRMETGLGRPLVACGGMAQLLVADRWGPFARATVEPLQALQSAREGARALIDIGQRPWWSKLLAEPGLRVIAALPDDASARPRTLMVSSEFSGPTGDDRTFWVTDSPQSEAAIIETFSTNGLAASLIAASGDLKLFVLNGYVQAGDERLNTVTGTLSGVIGTAPVF